MATVYRTLFALFILCLAGCGGGDTEPTCPAKLVGALSNVCPVVVSVDHAATLEISAEATIGSGATGAYDRTSLLSINGDGYGFVESVGVTPGNTRILITQTLQVQPGATSIGLSSYPHIEDTGSYVKDISITVIAR
jgi:hypothetical protein